MPEIKTLYKYLVITFVALLVFITISLSAYAFNFSSDNISGGKTATGIQGGNISGGGYSAVSMLTVYQPVFLNASSQDNAYVGDIGFYGQTFIEEEEEEEPVGGGGGGGVSLGLILPKRIIINIGVDTCEKTNLSIVAIVNVTIVVNSSENVKIYSNKQWVNSTPIIFVEGRNNLTIRICAGNRSTVEYLLFRKQNIGEQVPIIVNITRFIENKTIFIDFGPESNETGYVILNESVVLTLDVSWWTIITIVIIVLIILILGYVGIFHIMPKVLDWLGTKPLKY